MCKKAAVLLLSLIYTVLFLPMYKTFCFVICGIFGKYPSNENVFIYTEVIKRLPKAIYIEHIEPFIKPHLSKLIERVKKRFPFLCKHTLYLFNFLFKIFLKLKNMIFVICKFFYKKVSSLFVKHIGGFFFLYLYSKKCKQSIVYFYTITYYTLLIMFFVKVTTVIFIINMRWSPLLELDIITDPAYNVLNLYNPIGLLSTAFIFCNTENLISLIKLFISDGLDLLFPLNDKFYKLKLYCFTMMLWNELLINALQHIDDKIMYGDPTFKDFLVDLTYLLDDLLYLLDDFFYEIKILQQSVFLEINHMVIPLFFLFFLLLFTTVIISILFFSYLGLYGVFKLNVVTLIWFWLSLLFEFKNIFINQKVYLIKLSDWIFLTTNTTTNVIFYIDTIAFSFIFLTTTIALFVFIYAFSYFRYEPLVDRFLLFLLCFVISMLFLVSSGNIIMLFLGWELIGLTSFLLINFWSTKKGTLKSAFKAFTFNKISDFFMFMVLLIIYSTYYTFDIESINNQTGTLKLITVNLFNFQINLNELLALFILGAAFIKSAQFGGHAWLPDSMEAPVPASSLIHSATLVSAGIYLILRFNPLFNSTEYSKIIIPVVGSFTAAYGGMCAAYQSDIKKTLAYSTISHCGFLMVLCASNLNEFTILYLYVHGFFKAGVFMCVGNVLRVAKGYQDTRRMGSLGRYLPFEYYTIFVGLLNLAGLPFTFGFFVKHLIFISLGNHLEIYWFVVANCFSAALFGLYYSNNILTYTFMDFKKGNKSLYTGLNNVDYNSTYYSNTSRGSTLSIIGLYCSAYIITYFLIKYFVQSNFLFSDCLNLTWTSTYYNTATLTVGGYFGFVSGYTIFNTTVVGCLTALYISKYFGVQRLDLFLMFCWSAVVFYLIVIVFYSGL